MVKNKGNSIHFNHIRF